ncbi:MAG: transposase [Ideonella sp.]|nr:transposase [Ideonella sp.]MBE7425101.1 transposase [Ideonella sp.]
MWCFGAAAIVGAEHQRHVTGGGKASVRLPQFKAINTLLGNLKTAITGSYHAFDFATYAHRYLAEFQYRFNRLFNMKTILSRLLTAPVLAPPSSGQVLRVAEVSR